MFRSKFNLCSILLILLIAGLPAISYSQETERIRIQDPTTITPQQLEIAEITVTGLLSARESFIINTSGLTVGSTITIPGDAIPRALRQLYRTGLFSDVMINETERSSGRVKLEIVVQEQPRLDSYTIEGVKRSQRRELRDRLNLISGFAITDTKIAQARNTIQRYYREKGYWDTKIEVERGEVDPIRNRVSITFVIDPGERTKVRVIEFEGNEEFNDRKLRKSFNTIKQDRWWRIFKRHVYTRDEYEEGKEKLLTFYRNNGFRDVRIVEDTVFVDNWRRSKDGVFLEMVVHEGPQYKVRNVTWDGNTIYTDEQLTQVFGFYMGDIFNEGKFAANLQYNRDQSDITSLYQDRGYLFSRIMPEIRIVGEDSLDIHFDIVEDEIATIKDVGFTGNTKTHDDVVRRSLRTVPGQTYSRSVIIRTIRELGTLGYFNPEGIEPDVLPNHDDKTVDIIYNLDESMSTDNFEFSGGFGGRQIGLILAARVNFNNFSLQRAFEKGGWDPIPAGDGQRLSLGVQLTGRGYQSYSFSFTEPWLRGRQTSLGVSLSYDIINFRGTSFQTSNRRNELFSATVSLGKPLSWPDDFFTQRTSLSYQRYNVLGFTGVFQDGEANILSLKHQIERNSLDNFISPSSGSKMLLSGEIAPPLPGFAQYYKVKSEFQNHSTIIGRLVLSSSVEFGYMDYFATGQRSNFQRFFLGGTQIQQRQNFIQDNVDLRGFPGGFNGVVSPQDEERNLIGGQIYNKYSMELRYPAVTSEQVQLIPYMFFDAGNAFLDFNTFDPFNVKRAAGFGVRVFLPILGLIDLSYGYRLDGTPSSAEGAGLQAGQWEFLFNIGAPF